MVSSFNRKLSSSSRTWFAAPRVLARVTWVLALVSGLVVSGSTAFAQEEEEVEAPWRAVRVEADLSSPDPDAPFWLGVEARTLALVAQPMIRPRPAETKTSEVEVRAVHDGRWLALRLAWKDPEESWAGRLGEYSDAAAVQFPLQPGESPPPIFMGVRGMPVHIFHWRAQYQRDREVGKPTMRDLYPHLSIDMYPLEYADPGRLDPPLAAREQFSPGLAVGNPQSFPKSGVDEILAEGFSTSSVQDSAASGRATWKEGEWRLVIARPLAIEEGSTLAPGDSTFVAFAVWQGGAAEVGSRKSVTMAWTPLELDGGGAPAAVAEGTEVVAAAVSAPEGPR